MKRAGLFLSILFVTAPVWAGGSPGPIKDKNLEAALRAVLHEPKADLKDDVLAKVYILEATGKDIKDLSGLEKCKNVQLIRFDKNKIVDLGPLKVDADVEKEHALPLPPILGVAALVGGVVLVIVGGKK